MGERMSPKEGSMIQGPVRPGRRPAQRDDAHCHPDAARTAYRHPDPFARMSAVMDAAKYSTFRRARHRARGMPDTVYPDTAGELSTVGLKPVDRNRDKRPHST
eukprot:155141-Rhodomonas_salina.1